VLVTADGAGTLLDRRRVELVDGESATLPATILPIWRIDKAVAARRNPIVLQSTGRRLA
jgi:hypothetical protein